MCSAQRSGVISEKIVEFVARDLRPLSIVDGKGFKQLLNYIEPGYKVPSHTHITNLCQKKFREVKQDVSALLENKRVALTTDIWTSRSTQAYLIITAHYLTDDWTMVSKVLQTREMPERHTGIHISERIQEATREWKLTDDS